MEDILVPLGFFAIVPVIVFVVSRYRSQSHAASLQVVSDMVAQGQTPTKEIIQAIGVRQGTSGQKDLRVAAWLIPLAIALFTLSRVIPDDEAPVIMGSIATFPLLVGLAYLGLWFAFGRKAGS